MKVTINKDLDFIHQKGLRAFEITSDRGFYVLRAGKFKQIIKKSEYEQIIDASVKEPIVQPINIKPLQVDKMKKAELVDFIAVNELDIDVEGMKVAEIKDAIATALEEKE